MQDQGKVTISLGSGRNEDVELVISDTGPGILPEYQKKVFEPLFSTKTHGIGFGLSIAKMIVENHGGAIRVESESGKGAGFTIILPKAEKE